MHVYRPVDPAVHAEFATVELQGYWYAARLAMAELFEALGEREKATSLRDAAQRLRERVEERFWVEDGAPFESTRATHHKGIRKGEST